MGITYDQLKSVNDTINKIDVKGKGYAQVNDRVKAFRQLFPNGSIETEILFLDAGVVTMKAIVRDEESNVIATGLAQEKESSSFINKTSYIENCETSAVGRALGFAGIGVDGSMCSAEELANAITNQNKPEYISKKEQETLKSLILKKGMTVEDAFPNGLEKVTPAQYTDAVKKLNKLRDKKADTENLINENEALNG